MIEEEIRRAEQEGDGMKLSDLIYREYCRQKRKEREEELAQTLRRVAQERELSSLLRTG